MARPKAKIEWDRVGQMLEAGCSGVGIAGVLGIDEATLRKRCLKDLKISFSEFSQQKKAKGDDLIRLKQFDLAMKGDKTLLIWLGKQRLEQAERQDQKHEHSGGVVIEVEYVNGEGTDKA
jgi:hypothetical protein